MGNTTKNILQIGMIYAGTVLGAGFASGQEILSFFVRYGTDGLWGVLLAGLLFVAAAVMILYMTRKHDWKSYQQFLAYVLPRPLDGIFSVIITVFLGVTYVTMISGSGALVQERFGIPPVVGILLTSAVCYAVFAGKLSGVSVLNTLLTPIMTLGMVFVSSVLLFADTSAMAVGSTLLHNGYTSAFVYVGFNLLTASVVLVSTRELLDSRRTCVLGGALGGGLLMLCALLVYLVINRFTGLVFSSQLPMLQLAGRLGNVAYNLYGVVLYLAMITTAVSTGFGLLTKLHAAGLPYRPLCRIVCAAAIPLGFIRFSSLVGIFYTLFGYIGVFLILFLFFSCFSRAK